MAQKTRVMVAGIGGASLGTEIFKCLRLTGRYEIYGCDISRYAYGHYQKGFKKTFVIDTDCYFDNVLNICKKNAIRYIVPGGEQPMLLLGENEDRLSDSGITLVGNSADIIKQYSDKDFTFTQLKKMGFTVPKTFSVTKITKSMRLPFPCIIKPATNSGGSSFVFLASNIDEANLYVRYLILNNQKIVIQEYIPVDEGEYTVGVLSLPDQTVASSIALKRIFHSKLSISQKNNIGLISSGYTQGYIDTFSKICSTAEKIAKKIGSRGPLNIQGRVRDGVFLPFEINPRFSASSYLRALAGINEVDLFLQYLITGTLDELKPIQPGYYLRSFDEVAVRKKAVAR